MTKLRFPTEHDEPDDFYQPDPWVPGDAPNTITALPHELVYSSRESIESVAYQDNLNQTLRLSEQEISQAADVLLRGGDERGLTPGDLSEEAQRARKMVYQIWAAAVRAANQQALITADAMVNLDDAIRELEKASKITRKHGLHHAEDDIMGKLVELNRKKEHRQTLQERKLYPDASHSNLSERTHMVKKLVADLRSEWGLTPRQARQFIAQLWHSHENTIRNLQARPRQKKS